MKSILLILMVSLCGCSPCSFEDKPGKPPVKTIRVTLHSRIATEISMILDPNVLLENAIDLSSFGPFRPGLDLNSATQLYGPPVKQVYDNRYRLNVNIWDLTNSTVGLISVPGSFPPPQWQLRAYPHSNATTNVFLNDALLEQVAKLIPNNLPLNVMISADNGHVELFMRQTTITYLSLSRWGKYSIFKQ